MSEKEIDELKNKIQLLKDTTNKIAGIIKKEWKYGEEEEPAYLTEIANILEAAHKQGIESVSDLVKGNSIFLYFVNLGEKMVRWMSVCVPSGDVDGPHWFKIGADGKFKERCG